MKKAPIAIFAYNRPAHFMKTIDALLKNELADESELFIFSDGPRSNEDRHSIEQVRKNARRIKGFKKVTLIERKINYGLADSIVEGVTTLIEKYGRVIVLEDDLVTSPFFLSYMNEALDRYAYDERVMHIAAYMPPIDTNGLPESFFLRQSSCWGWASWHRAWKHFTRDGKSYIQSFDRETIHRFNLDGAYDYWSQLIANEEKRLKTWAVYWYACVFERGGLCLHPRKSLVANRGFDGSGENCGKVSIMTGRLGRSKIEEFPEGADIFLENKIAIDRLKNFIYANQKAELGFKHIMKSKAFSMVKRLISNNNKSFIYLLINRLKNSANRMLIGAAINRQFIKTKFNYVTFGKNVQLTGVSDIRIGKGSCIGDNVWLNTNIRGSGIKMNIGRCVLIGRNSVISSCSLLEIGDYTFTGANVLVSNSLHEYNDISRLYIKGVKDTGPLVIEENCWLSFGVIIYGGITIGRGSIVGASSVVTTSVPPFTVVAGNPSKIVKMYNPVTEKWERVLNAKDQSIIEKDRLRIPLPSRKDYLNILSKYAQIKQIDPLCAGRARWI